MHINKSVVVRSISSERVDNDRKKKEKEKKNVTSIVKNQHTRAYKQTIKHVYNLKSSVGRNK